MAILVSGATGFLGRRLVLELVASGSEVVALYRTAVPEGLDVAGVRWVRWDLADAPPQAAAFPEIDTLVHLAGETAGAKTDAKVAEQFYLAANELTTVAILQAFAPQLRRVVLASSQVVYGGATGLAVTETWPVQGNGAYSVSKVNSENWARWFQARHGGCYVALRLSGFIDGGGLVDYLIDTMLASEPVRLFAQGRVRRDYLPAADGVAALLQATRAEIDEGFWPVNIGSGQIVSAHELAEIVQAALESDAEILLEDRESAQGDFIFDISSARALLGFGPSDLRSAVRRYAEQRKAQTMRQAS